MWLRRLRDRLPKDGSPTWRWSANDYDRPDDDNWGVSLLTWWSNVSLTQWMLRGLLLVTVIGVAWTILAGRDGYQLGTPPQGLQLSSACYRIVRPLFVIPMYKQVDVSECSSTAP